MMELTWSLMKSVFSMKKDEIVKMKEAMMIQKMKKKKMMRMKSMTLKAVTWSLQP